MEQYLRKGQRMDIVGIKPHGSKRETRFGDRFDQNWKNQIPKTEAWIMLVGEQLVGFWKERHDDLVDAFTIMVNHAFGKKDHELWYLDHLGLFLHFCLDLRGSKYTLMSVWKIYLSNTVYMHENHRSRWKQALSIDSQISEMHKIAEQEWLEIVETLTEKVNQPKPQDNAGSIWRTFEWSQRAKIQRYPTWAPDRLSRNAGDLGSIVDMMDEGYLCRSALMAQLFK